MIRALVFDMDGLMFETERLGLKAWEYGGRQLHVDIGEHVVRQMLGMNQEGLRQFLKGRFGEQFDFDRCFRHWGEYMRKTIEEQGVPLKRGLVPLLGYLKANGYRAAMATSSNRPMVLWYLEKAGVGGYFDEIITGDSIRHGKPAPDIYQKAAEALLLAPEECMALEDSLGGICSAYSAGMKPVMVPDLVLPTSEIEPLLYALVDSLDEVIPLLEADKHDYA